MTKDKALTLALEALERVHQDPKGWWNCHVEITAIKEALVPMRTTCEVQSKRKPLTKSQIIKIIHAHTHDDNGHDEIWVDGEAIARAIEAAHDITGKNT